MMYDKSKRKSKYVKFHVYVTVSHKQVGTNALRLPPVSFEHTVSDLRSVVKWRHLPPPYCRTLGRRKSSAFVFFFIVFSNALLILAVPQVRGHIAGSLSPPPTTSLSTVRALLFFVAGRL